MWPAAWAVSNYLLSEPDLRDNLSSLSILELGTGTGLISLSAAMGGCTRVLATDYEPLALELTRYAADKITNNVCIGDDTSLPLSRRLETRLLDLCALEEQPLPLKFDAAIDFDIVVAADIMVRATVMSCFVATKPLDFLLLQWKSSLSSQLFAFAHIHHHHASTNQIQVLLWLIEQ